MKKRVLAAFALPLLLAWSSQGRSIAAEGDAAAAPAPKAAAPAAQDEAKSKEQNAVVEQILKDKEDLITGKRFSYDPAGRRDPFRSLLDRIDKIKGPRPKGVRGMLVTEVDLVGVVKDPNGNIGFFRGSDNKGYFLHVGDEVYDGKIIGIDPRAGTVTFRQQVDDPRQIKPYRDIVKRLTPQSEEEAQ